MDIVSPLSLSNRPVTAGSRTAKRPTEKGVGMLETILVVPVIAVGSGIFCVSRWRPDPAAVVTIGGDDGRGSCCRGLELIDKGENR